MKNRCEPWRANEQLRLFLDSAPDAMLLINQEGRILFANAPTAQVFEFGREELLGRPVVTLLPEYDRISRGAVHRANAGSPTVRRVNERLELLGRRQDGSEFVAEITFRSIQAEEGPLTVVAIRDITEGKKTEATYRAQMETQSALASLLRFSLEPLSLEKLLERTLDLLLSLPWIRLESKGAILLVEDDPQLLVMQAQRGLTEPVLASCHRVPFGHCLCGTAACDQQVVFASCVDERHVVHYSDMTPHGHYCIPILSEDAMLGVLTLYVQHGHERDSGEESFLTSVAQVLAGIVKRKRTEEALRKSEERFELAIKGTDAGIWDWNLLTDEVHFSARWKSMLGYEEHEIQHHFNEWQTRVHPDDRAHALRTVRDYLAGRTSEYELEHRLQHKDGSYRWILARGAAVFDPTGNPCRMLGSHLDITDRKRSEALMLERERELVAAQRIQEHLLPDSAPCFAGFDIAGSLLPAEFAAGDYFDYLSMPDGSLGIVVGDVCGHGFSAALLMAATSAHLRSFVLEHSEIGEILRHVNTLLCQETEEGRFVTLVLAQIKPNTRRLTYANLGHPPGYVLGASGNVKCILHSSGPPLAVLADINELPSGQVALEPEDIVLLTTDGIADACSPDGCLFGTHRMLNIVRANRGRKASEIVASLQQAVFEFTGQDKLQDDATTVVIKVEATSL